ncbi:MAG TPA: glutathione S-transferase N-terminal domain-containing protein [Solirubrobacteraceae bacterium]
MCDLGEDGNRRHACRIAAEGLRNAGNNFELLTLDRTGPGRTTAKGSRPELLAMTGQEKLPALRLIDQTTIIVGSKPIVAWAEDHDRATIGKPVPVPGAPSGRAKEDEAGNRI